MSAQVKCPKEIRPASLRTSERARERETNRENGREMAGREGDEECFQVTAKKRLATREPPLPPPSLSLILLTRRELPYLDLSFLSYPVLLSIVGSSDDSSPERKERIARLCSLDRSPADEWNGRHLVEREQKSRFQSKDRSHI